MKPLPKAFIATALSLGLFATSSTNYRLDSYGIGSGGSSGSSSNNYRLDGISGETSTPGNSTTYQENSGTNATMQANVPAAPTVTNPSNYYNKLHIVVNDGSNASDATFAIAISTDSFATTQYIQNDTTVGSTLGTEDYQTYSSWGSASGFDVIGLTPNTTYSVKVKAEHGDFTESAYSPVASAATVGTTLSFDIDISSSDTETSSPYATSFGNLLPGTVTDSPERIWIDFDTNGATGGSVFVAASNAGLSSAITSYTITSATGDLASLSEGFGARSISASQSSGGPLTAQAPYNGSSDNVGILNTSIRQVYNATGPIVAGRGSLVLKAKSQAVTPAASDYTSAITLIAAASF